MESQELWRRLEDHLCGSGAGDAAAGSDGVRPNQYLSHLEGERRQLAAQLAAAQQEHGEAVARLDAAQAAIGKLQGVVHRLSAAGGSGADPGAGYAGLLGPPDASPAALPAAGPPAVAMSGLSGTASEAEAWAAEKRLLKAICKMALAVTMDQVAGG